MRILVAEDERVLANTIATALRAALEVEVDVAFDGSSAQEFVQRNDYQLVVIDFCLPPPTGLELVGLVWLGFFRGFEQRLLGRLLPRRTASGCCDRCHESICGYFLVVCFR